MNSIAAPTQGQPTVALDGLLIVAKSVTPPTQGQFAIGNSAQSVVMNSITAPAQGQPTIANEAPQAISMNSIAAPTQGQPTIANWSPTDDGWIWWDASMGIMDAVPPLVAGWEDQSGGGHFWYQLTAARQPTLTTTPAGRVAMKFDGDYGGFVLNSSLGSATDHTFVAGCHPESIPQSPNANTSMLQGSTPVGLFFQVDANGSGYVGVSNLNQSNLVPTADDQTFAWVADGTALTCWCYRNGVKASGTVACVAAAFSTAGIVRLAEAYNSLGFDGWIWKVAYRNSKATDAQLYRINLWANH